MSWVWSTWITEPAPRNSRALNQAWVKRWKTAALYAPTPRPNIIRPRWLMVEYATMRLMSSWATAQIAAIRLVSAPRVAITASDAGLAANSG